MSNHSNSWRLNINKIYKTYQDKVKIIEDFFEGRGYSKKNTIRNYRCTINQFFQFLDIKNPNDYPNSKRDFEADVKAFCKSIFDNSPKTYVGKMSGISKFFKYYKLPFPTEDVNDLRKLNIGSVLPVVMDEIPQTRDIQKILYYGGIKQKAFFLTLLSSGMRLDEALHIKIGDVDFDYKPNDEITITKINIRRELTKKRRGRVTFISDEATGWLKEWLNGKDGRDAFLKKYKDTISNINKNVTKDVNTNRVFPFSQPAVSRMFIIMLKASGLDRKVSTNLRDVYTIHPHSLRKFFRTNMAVGMNIDILHQIIGHTEYLTQSYRNHPTYRLAEEYYNSQHLVKIFDSGIPMRDFKQLKGEVEIRKNDINELRKKHSNEIQKIREEMEGRMRTEREYSIIINQILTDKIKVSDYEMKLIEEFGIEGLPQSEEELNYLIEENQEFRDFCELIEKIKAERKKKRKTIF